MSAALEIRDLSVLLGQKDILSSLSLAVDEGEFAAVLGLNGAGKTTLMRAVCGLIPCEGSISVLGCDVKRLDERRRAKLISYFPQNSAVGKGISVLQTVLMGYTAENGIFCRVSERQMQAALSLLDSVGLSSFAERDAATLSQGERQLVIFCRCMAQNAPVMLLDEPDSALDLSNRVKLLSMVRDAVHKNKTAGLTAIHDPNFALACCDRIIVLKNGSVAGEIRPKESSADDIKTVLAALYGDVDISVRNGVPFIFPEVSP